MQVAARARAVIMTPVSKGSVARKTILARQRVQLGGALLLAVGLPFLIRMSLPVLGTQNDFTTAVIGNLVAVVLGHYILRSLTIYPGIVAGFYVLPSFAISYALVLIVFWTFRLDYSRFLFLIGFPLCFLWYVVIFFALQRRQSFRIALVPFGEVGMLGEIGKVEWTTLTRPPTARGHGFDAIVADFRADLPGEWERFLADCALSGTIVYHCKQLQESLTGRVAIEHLSENTFGLLVPALLYVKLKRLVDFSTAAVASLLFLPVLAVVGLAIKLDSPGPILFRQRRVGAGGKAFRVIKFRTMSHNGTSAAPHEIDQAITIENDPRITRVGRFLRRTRIDELPQMFNVLAGTMSWIGPRPEAEVLSRWYEAELPFYHYRHVVKPGITGWAQVNQGHVATMHQVHGKLQYDFYYIKYFSLWLDVLIVFRTIATVVTGYGSR
jgi:lipopolysaccharide/colanic/teichoic acid biosynthesis glycosyltransferase